MKFICIIAIACFVAQTLAVPSCVAANYCMSCSNTTANVCTGCFNWGSGKVGVRQLNATTNDCKTGLATVHKVTDTKVYQGSITSTNTALGSSDVQQCKKTFKNFDNSAVTKVLSCSKTAATLTGSVTCKKISNCEQTQCWKESTLLSYNTCTICKKGYAGSAWQATSGASTACAKYTAISNCDYPGRTGAATYGCNYCKSKYAVSSLGTTCLSYTAIKNCRVLHTDNTNCNTCWDAYYWDTTKCKLAAKVVIVGAIMALINFLF